MSQEHPPLAVGGQAVLEGVMMRSPRAVAIAVRKSDGSIALKDEPFISLGERYPLLKRPFFRGPVILFEALVLGVKALNFSAQAALEEEETSLGSGAIFLTLAGAFALAFVLFGFLPHWLTGALGYLGGPVLTPADFAFHLVDALIKAAFILLYIWGISFFKDIHRVFEYHGAEHKCIFTYESGEPLDVDHARGHPTCHPRCGTSFILVVLLVSLVVFAAFFPLIPFLSKKGLIATLIQVLVKTAFLIPIAAVGYEIIRWGGHTHTKNNLLARALVWPGLITQRLTALEPDDSQLEVALTALKAVLVREGVAEIAGEG